MFIIHHGNPSVVAGIDPGASGALAFIDFKSWTLEVHDMPHFWEEVNGRSVSVWTCPRYRLSFFNITCV